QYDQNRSSRLSGAALALAKSVGIRPRNQVRTGLPAGGNRIRTIGPSRENASVLFDGMAIARRRKETGSAFSGDRWFESRLLQWRVCKPPVPLGRGAEPEIST